MHAPLLIWKGYILTVIIILNYSQTTSMAVTNQAEQVFTHRPDSYVPGRTIATHLGLDGLFASHPDILNHMHHFGMGVLTGPFPSNNVILNGIIGPVASFMHTGIRIMMDQVVENTAGVSALPWTWPINEQVIDICCQKGVYALVTGYICDRMVRGVEWFN